MDREQSLFSALFTLLGGAAATVTMVALRAFFVLLVVCVVQPLLLAFVKIELLLLYLFPFWPSGWLSLLERFAPFLYVPFIAVGIVAGAYLFRSKASVWRRLVVVNALIFTTFFVTAELYKDVLILAEVLATPHDCLHIHSFVGSVHRWGEYAPAHALMIKGDVPYFWSYSELTFVEGEPKPWLTCPQPLFRL